jgi:anaerobic selenocysteine-containing dehydrogenase
MDHKIKGQGDQFVLINAADAEQRGIKEGDKVQVFNDRGAFEGDARITDDVNAGIIVATLGYWRQLNTGTVNSISSAEFVDMGHAPTFSDNLVQIKLVTQDG